MSVQSCCLAFTFAFASLGLLSGCASVPDQSGRPAALFEKHWQATAEIYPTSATYRGDHRYGDRHRDRSPEGVAREEQYWRSILAEARALKSGTFSREDELSLQLFEHIAGGAVESQRHAGLRTYTVGAGFNPFQAFFAALLGASPTDSEARVEQILARIAAYPKRIDEEIANLRHGIALGWVPPRPVLAAVLQQLDAQLAAEPGKSGYFVPFTRLGSGIPEATRQTLRQRGLTAIEQHVYPATRKLREFVATEYLGASAAEGGLHRYPGGREAYDYLVRSHTTTSLTPQEIHRVGLAKVASLRKDMDELIKRTGFVGDFRAFLVHANTDPKFFYTSPDEMLAGYRDITKRLDAEMPRLFAELPRAPYGVRALPDFMGPGAAETYSAPSLDGTRPGWFNANTMGFKVRPKWGMPAIAAHETVPGHHMQTGRAVEMKSLPAFRRQASFTAYNEGWALYAEVLADEIGFYTDPYNRFGFLQNQAWRAARLVVDTGMHSEGWTRQQAIDYMIDVTGFAPVRVASEIDRYLSLPGQALSYMIGQIRIQEFRARAQQALGARFDLRRFHMVILDSGQLPLDVLARVVDEWIEGERKRS